MIAFSISFGIIVLVLLGLLFGVAGIFNKLIASKNIVKNGWSQVEVQLKRRHDLIPNLVETAKMYMQHERETLESVIKARQQVINLSGVNVADKGKLESMLSETLKSLFAVAENYPNLKANESFATLQEEITSTENRIAYARQFYNDAVMELNNIIEMFPTNLIASMFNFKSAEFFEIEIQEERQAPVVSKI